MNLDERTYDTITQEQLTLLKTKIIAVVGSGALGGYVIERLARFGVGRLSIIDEAKKRVEQIHSGVHVMPIHKTITEENAFELLTGVDFVMDFVDNVRQGSLWQSSVNYYRYLW